MSNDAKQKFILTATDDAGTVKVGHAIQHSNGTLSIHLRLLQNVISGIPAVAPDVDMDEQLQYLVAEIKRAEEKFSEHDGYVGVNFFVNRWKSAYLADDVDVRRKLIDKAAKEGLVEVYDAEADIKGIRTKTTEG